VAVLVANKTKRLPFLKNIAGVVQTFAQAALLVGSKTRFPTSF